MNTAVDNGNNRSFSVVSVSVFAHFGYSEHIRTHSVLVIPVCKRKVLRICRRRFVNVAYSHDSRAFKRRQRFELRCGNVKGNDVCDERDSVSEPIIDSGFFDFADKSGLFRKKSVCDFRGLGRCREFGKAAFSFFEVAVEDIFALQLDENVYPRVFFDKSRKLGVFVGQIFLRIRRRICAGDPLLRCGRVRVARRTNQHKGEYRREQSDKLFSVEFHIFLLFPLKTG